MLTKSCERIEQRAFENKWKRGAERYERILVQMQIGTSAGPCALLGGGILIADTRVADCSWNALGVTSILVGIVLLTLGRLNRAQLRNYVFALTNDMDNCPSQPESSSPSKSPTA